jgi:branched-subunit amino acid ABC-type transport system permease component
VPDGGLLVASPVSILIEQLLNAVALAALLFLVSVGLSLVFGILRVVNFAHGVFYMLGAYVSFTTVALTGSFWLSLALVPPVVGILGALLESSTLRFIYRRPPIYQLLLTFGLALMLEEGVRIVYGPTAKPVDPPLVLQGAVTVAGLAYPRYRLFLVVLGIAVGLGLWLLLTRTRWPTAWARTCGACAPSCSASPARSPGSAASRPRR